MARAKFERTKDHVNIGTIGHVSHGKTTLTAAITKVLAASGKARAMNCEDIDAAPDERERGIGIHTRYIEYETDKRHYAHIDCPGHAQCMKNAIAGMAQMDAAILVVSAADVVDNVMPQTREQVLITKHLGVDSLVVFINQQDRMDNNELSELAELEIRLLLEEYEFPSSEIPIVSGSALLAMEAIAENPQIKPGENKWVDKIFELIEKIDYYIPTPKREIDKPFLMAIENIFPITGRGAPVVVGRIERGSIEVGKPVEIVDIEDTYGNTLTILAIETFLKTLDRAIAGDNVGLRIGGTRHEGARPMHGGGPYTLYPGMIIAQPGTITAHTEFESEVYVLTTEEGGSHTPIEGNYHPQFYLHTAEITGIITDYTAPDDEKVMPGDRIIMTVKLTKPIAMEEELPFVIRDDDRTIGIGVVDKIIK